MADAMLKKAEAQLAANEQYIAMLTAQLKTAREAKKVLRAVVKREKEILKERKKTLAIGGGGDSVRCYCDNAQNRKLGRVGKPIPSRKKSA